jgi:hypothetical protein
MVVLLDDDLVGIRSPKPTVASRGPMLRRVNFATSIVIVWRIIWIVKYSRDASDVRLLKVDCKSGAANRNLDVKFK